MGGRAPRISSRGLRYIPRALYYRTYRSSLLVPRARAAVRGACLRHITLVCPGDFCQGRKPTEPSSGITGRRTTSESWRDKRALESAGSLYYLSCYIPPVRASCYIEFSSVLALNVQSICSSLGHETCRWVWGRGFHAVWKPKYYESKPRIFVPRQIEVQRKVEVGGGGKFSKTRHLGDIDVQRPGLKG